MRFFTHLERPVHKNLIARPSTNSLLVLFRSSDSTDAQNIVVRLPSKTHSKCKRRPATEESSRREHGKAECLSTNCELIY
jgi:hypothetical protein